MKEKKQNTPISLSKGAQYPKLYLGIALNRLNASAYGGFDGVLKGCENDIHDIRTTIAHDYEPLCLFTEGATIANVQHAFETLINLVTNGVKVIINYSGHGGQYQDGSVTRETICLYDGQMPEKMLQAYLNRLANKGAIVTTIFDCCHAGGMDRKLMAADTILDFDGFDTPSVKALTPDVALASASNVTKSPVADVKLSPKSANITHLFACKKGESALDGAKNGLFTVLLLQTFDACIEKSLAFWVSQLDEKAKGYQTPQLKFGDRSSTNDAQQGSVLVKTVFS